MIMFDFSNFKALQATTNFEYPRQAQDFVFSFLFSAVLKEAIDLSCVTVRFRTLFVLFGAKNVWRICKNLW